MREPIVLAAVAISSLMYCIIAKYIEKRKAIKEINTQEDKVILLLE